MRTGINAETGKVLTGWDHCAQSLRKCITLRFRSRVMRRHLASVIPVLQDANADPGTIFKVYVGIAEAINDPDGGEPAFNLLSIELAEKGREGRFFFILTGHFFPLGHLGDFSVRQDRSFDYAAAGLIQ